MNEQPSLDERAVAAAAEIVLAKLGLSLDQIAGLSKTRVMPTFAEYVPQVAKTMPESSSKTWRYYWQVLVDEWGDRPIDEPRASEINQLANLVQQRAAAKPQSSTGRGARSLFIDAVKCLYRCAAGDKLITLAESPVAAIKNVKHRSTSRRALTPHELAEINTVAAGFGPDPLLDSLLLRLHSETACRAGGALSLRRRDLNPMDVTILLREKGDKSRRQPVSPTLFNALLEHVGSRVPGREPNDQVLRLRNGGPFRYHNYQTFWNRIWRILPWAKALGVTSHWLRYTTLTWVERSFGYAVAAAYAGHSGPSASSDRGGATLTYTSATIHEVAAALSALTGEPHPLAELATHEAEVVDLGTRQAGPLLAVAGGTSKRADGSARLRGDR
ncbi:tyrosine-type recombinase/integrase [Amycolatopsis sp. NPDC051371]|uniref:tyrosine-type recombinase/integrase n=1 Tax=Amycolatopsis sp. NPDC051371 TaxID=3155800 RepID=UPI003424BD0C